MAFMDKLQAGDMQIEGSAFEELKTSLLTMFTRVARH